MADSLVIDCSAPEGEPAQLVQLTAAEVAALDALRASAVERDAALAVLEANDCTLQERLADALAVLENAHANWGSLTGPQKDAVAKLGVRVQAALIRRTLRRLDTAG